MTTIHRKDSISNISKQQYAKYEACPVASEKKQQNNAKKIKLVLPTNPVKNADSNHYSASVGIPVRSFLTNNSNKLTHLKNQVKGGLYETKGDNAMELQKMQQNKSAKISVSSTYLKKFKSHHAQSKLTAN